MTPTVFSFATSAYVPLGLAFFGLGTGYLIFGPQELFGFPAKSEATEISNGWWGFWMPGMLQFLCGTYILVGLTWFHVFKGAPLYAAGIETTVFGIHWLAMGLSRIRGGSIVPNGFMCVAFFLVALLGYMVFSHVGDTPVAWLFIGLMAVYFFEFFYCFDLFMPLSRRLLGLVHTVTGLLLMYLTFGIVLNLAIGAHWTI
jgi:hypothetical protein